MKKKYLKKIMVILLLLAAAAGLGTYFYMKHLQKEKAPYVETDRVERELTAVSEVLDDGKKEEILNILSGTEEYLDFQTFSEILVYYPEPDLSFMEDYKGKKWLFSEKDWNEYLVCLIESTDSDRLSVQNVLLAGDGSFVETEEGETLADGFVLTSAGVLKNATGADLKEAFLNLRIVKLDDSLLSVMEKNTEPVLLKNCYVVNASDDSAELKKGLCHLHISPFMQKGLLKDTEGEIVDISADRGAVTAVTVKKDTVSGKLLRVCDGEIEIENAGVFPIQDEMEGYRVCDRLKSAGRKDLPLGYDCTDFILEDGEVAACLVKRTAVMDQIRVLVRNSGFEKKRHDEIVLSCSGDMEMIRLLDGREAGRENVSAGETLSFSGDTFSGDDGYLRVKLVPLHRADRIILHSVERAQGRPEYRGCMEITADEDGLILVNELPLEEYLKLVVPSEMPAYFPMEALKAQAVCARTYAYGRMVHTGLPSYGAHLDDSAAFQVYNNVNLKEDATEAVKETGHLVLLYDDGPIGTYYYSTSAGCGSEIAVWHGGAEQPPYLKPKEIGRNPDENLPLALTDNETFNRYITATDAGHYESEEGWYRWKVKVDETGPEQLKEILEKRYENRPDLILTMDDEGNFQSREIPCLGEIQDIRIVKRLAGGMADELLITGSEATVKVISELNIRHVLSPDKVSVERQSGDVVSQSMLPSAFISVQPDKTDGAVTGYTVYGGGFGHGIGMSQTGARDMAEEGMNCRQILSFFFEGSQLTEPGKNTPKE